MPLAPGTAPVGSTPGGNVQAVGKLPGAAAPSSPSGAAASVTASSPDHIAVLFLTALGAPTTPDMVRAVTVWLRAENSNPSLRNNPWNLHQGAACGTKTGDFCARTVLPGQIGVQNAGPKDKNVAVFSTIEAGTTANANNLVYLQNSGYGYDKVIAAARAGNATGFLDALARSAWSETQYGGPANNSLLASYNAGGGGGTWATTPGTAGAAASGTNATLASDVVPPQSVVPMVPAWGGLVSFPQGHVLTAADVDTIMAKLYDGGYFTDSNGVQKPGAATAQSAIRDTLMTEVGKPWNAAMLADIQASLFGKATSAADPVGTVGAAVIASVAPWAGGLTTLLAFLADPENWAYIIALMIGVPMAGYGLIRLSR